MTDTKYEYKYVGEFVQDCICCGAEAPLATFGDGGSAQDLCEFCATSMLGEYCQYPKQHDRAVLELGKMMGMMANLLVDKITGRRLPEKADTSRPDWLPPQDRTHRAGRQPAPVHVEIIDLNNIDEHVRETLERKSFVHMKEETSSGVQDEPSEKPMTILGEPPTAWIYIIDLELPDTDVPWCIHNGGDGIVVDGYKAVPFTVEMVLDPQVQDPHAKRVLIFINGWERRDTMWCQGFIKVQAIDDTLGEPTDVYKGALWVGPKGEG